MPELFTHLNMSPFTFQASLAGLCVCASRWHWLGVPALDRSKVSLETIHSTEKSRQIDESFSAGLNQPGSWDSWNSCDDLGF